MNVAIELNIVIVRNATLLASADQFLEEFGSCAISSLVKILLGYDLVELDEKFRDFKTFTTFLGLIRMITFL